MIKVRSIITEALNRSNLVSLRQTPPADMVETSYRLLKGICAKYSNDNLLQFLVSDCEHVLDKSEYVVGTTDASHPETYLAVDMEAPELQKVNKVYWKPVGDERKYGSYVEMQYAAPSDFDMYPVGSSVYTFQSINDLQGILKVKVVPNTNMKLKLSYNRKWNMTLDTELRIPEQYVELFITALTHKLAMSFPRLNTEQVKLLKDELTEIENNVKTATRAVKYVGRKPTQVYVDHAAFMSGSMFFQS